MFITFEGPEGSGKSTQIQLLAQFLETQGYHVVQTREPGGTVIGDQIRHVLHDVANTEMVATTEVLLYSASRAQLVAQLIRPHLAAGNVVLCDRFADSTMAYQGYGRYLDHNMLTQLTQIATGGLKPDLTILLDIDVEEGLNRKKQGHTEMNRLDLEAISFHKRVRDGYHQLAAAEPARWVIIDANRPVDAVQTAIQQAVYKKGLKIED
ncbi:MAG: dTMP kinase [Candidatus Promineifilaceae bacterium]